MLDGEGSAVADESDRYVPIDCGVHDQLLERATLGQRTEIVYHADNGQVVSVRDVIEDVFSRRGAEYLRFQGGLEIRLDKIIEIG